MPPKKSKAKLPVRGQVQARLQPLLVADSAPLPTPKPIPHKHAGTPSSELFFLSVFDQSFTSDLLPSSGSPPDEVADDPYGATDPFRVKDTGSVIDPGDLWQEIDNSNRREAGRTEWEEAQQIDPSAKAEELYPEAPDRFAMSSSEWSRHRVDELLKHKEASRCGLIKDQDIHDAIKAGPDMIEKLRDRERRWILDKEGIPPKRPITTEDLDILYNRYVNLLGAPGHKVPGCDNCKKASVRGQDYFYTINRMTFEGGRSTEQWHYPDRKDANQVDRACSKFLRALVGFARQEKRAKANVPIVLENIEREKTGKKPIPLNETRVEKWVREIDEGIRVVPIVESDSESETEEEAARRWDLDFESSQDAMARMREKEDEERNRIAWQRYKGQERLSRMRGASVTENFERKYSRFSDYYPVGLPYNGKLVHDRADIAPEDWERFKKHRSAFEEEEARTLPAGAEKEKWDKYIDGVLEEYRPPRGILTSEPKGSQ
ncbi:MAG: hypothetical protein Q9219_000482 [cf. Caloplaca sp. 3 TL-2023]